MLGIEALKALSYQPGCASVLDRLGGCRFAEVDLMSVPSPKTIEQRQQRRRLVRVLAPWLAGLWVAAALVTPLATLRPAAARPGGALSLIYVAPFVVPASLPELGVELARAMHAALREANIPAQLGKGEVEHTVSGRLEEISSTRVRLHASFRGVTVQSVGDLEHLDDLVYAVFTQLRPRLLTVNDSGGGAPGGSEKALRQGLTGAAVVVGGPAVKELGPKNGPDAARFDARPSDSAAAVGTKTKPPQSLPAKPDVAVSKSLVKVAEKNPDKRTEAALLHASAGPATSKSATGPAVPIEPATPPRPRLAVHVVGEPLVQVPTGFSGLGAAGQQSIVAHLQRRWDIAAVASRAVGLTNGLEALGQAMRVGAHHSLMVRLDALSVRPASAAAVAAAPVAIGAASYGGGYYVLTGRIHVVLLLDGKLLFDKSFALPATALSSTEAPSTAYSRALTVAIDYVATDLATSLGHGSKPALWGLQN